MDLAAVPTIDHPDFADILIANRRNRREKDRDHAREMAIEFIEQVREARRTRHAGPFLIALTFLVFAELNEQQRERFVSSMSLRQVNTEEYTYLMVAQLLIKLFASTPTGVPDPLLRHNRRSTFIVLDEEEGYWVQDADNSGYMLLKIMHIPDDG